VSKTALHLAGEPVEGQTELFQRWCGLERVQMVALAGPLRVGLVTRHLALRDAIEALNGPLVMAHLELLASFLGTLGLGKPRIGLAGLNPHAGEGGRFGHEELDFLNDAVVWARGQGVDVRGPLSPDAVFRDALEGRLDGVLALYHDQAFIPLKLIGGERAVTALAGMPYLRLSPVHGTAFDIAGRGLASHENLLETLLLAADWAGPQAGGATPAAGASEMSAAGR
jgi:4-hydroxythreonine-4-phosphate dehydrogenase